MARAVILETAPRCTFMGGPITRYGRQSCIRNTIRRLTYLFLIQPRGLCIRKIVDERRLRYLSSITAKLKKVATNHDYPLAKRPKATSSISLSSQGTLHGYISWPMTRQETRGRLSARLRPQGACQIPGVTINRPRDLILRNLRDIFYI